MTCGAECVRGSTSTRRGSWSIAQRDWPSFRSRDCVWARRPSAAAMGNPECPAVGIFAQRGRNRPNRIGVMACRLVAIDGTSVLDIKSQLREFGPRGMVKQPVWATELMLWYQGAVSRRRLLLQRSDLDPASAIGAGIGRNRRWAPHRNSDVLHTFAQVWINHESIERATVAEFKSVGVNETNARRSTGAGSPGRRRGVKTTARGFGLDINGCRVRRDCPRHAACIAL